MHRLRFCALVGLVSGHLLGCSDDAPSRAGPSPEADGSSTDTSTDDSRDAPGDSTTLSCSDAGSAQHGDVVITTLSTDGAGNTSCGAALAIATFDFYPSDGSAPLRGQSGLDYAGAPLTRTCAELLGMQVGKRYSNVALESYAGGCHFEHYTDSPSTYGKCYRARCAGEDAGMDAANDASGD